MPQLSVRQETTMARAGTSLRSSIREKFSQSNRSASNVLTSRSSKKTAGNKTKRKMEYWRKIPRVMMMTFHLWNKRLIFTSKEVPALEKVFASTAELCSVNFSLSPLLWNYGIAVTFWVLCTCWNFYSFLWYWPACTYKFVRDRSLMKGSTVTSLRYSCKTLKTSKSWIMILVKRNKLTPYGNYRLQRINAGWENHHPPERLFSV